MVYYKKALLRDSNDVMANMGAADIHMQQQEFEKALRLYERALR